MRWKTCMFEHVARFQTLWCLQSMVDLRSVYRPGLSQLDSVCLSVVHCWHHLSSSWSITNVWRNHNTLATGHNSKKWSKSLWCCQMGDLQISCPQEFGLHLFHQEYHFHQEGPPSGLSATSSSFLFTLKVVWLSSAPSTSIPLCFVFPLFPC